jgi:hypothetical protein
VYEATFLKNFVAHALHPNQLDACISDGHESYEDIRQYLRSISDNVDKLATKMIWSAHSRTVRFMANDDKATTPFWDYQQFDDQCFADFFPGNAFSVVAMMNQSWHRAFSHPSMLRYSARQYQTGPDASPFEEIDDVTGHTMLFEDRSEAHAASHDRVVRPPRTKKPKNQHLPSATLREDTTMPRSGWLQDLVEHGAGGGPGFTQILQLPVTLDDTSQDARPLTALPENDVGVCGAQDIWSGTVGAVDGFCSAHGSSMHMGNEAGSTSVCPPYSQFEIPAHMENPVASHELDVLYEEPGLSSLLEHTPSEGTGRKAFWRMALIEDHKQRLAERWPKLQQPRGAPVDFDSYVDRAIKQGDLKCLVPGLRRIVDFVDPPAVASSSSGPQVESQNREKHRHRPESLSDVDRFSQSEPVIQQDSQTGTTDNDSVRLKRRKKQRFVDRSTKRRRSAPSAKKSETPMIAEPTSKPNTNANLSPNVVPIQTHPGFKSRTLEDHQQLPPDAYFEKTANDEQPAWRCGIKHPMGYYYNAGDRKNCPGCFTALRENPKRKVMDFYLPSRSHFFQPAPPGSTWKPGKPSGKPRRSKTLSHNSIAKDAYWDAINTGATTDEAWGKGIEAVEAYLRAKGEKKERKEPTPEPTPEPVDLGPHPSGSKTMEHGQELPIGAYWEKKSRYDEYAWRCDVNHALGRYYLGGDVRSCPGCGSCRTGPGQHSQMDFYLPAGSIARQALDLVKWKPRPPYILTKKSKRAKQIVTHNQLCSKKYWELIGQGREHVEGGANADALTLAIKLTDVYVDAKVAAILGKLDESESSEEEQHKAKYKSNRKGNGKLKELRHESNGTVRQGRSSARLFSHASSPPVVRRKRGCEELNDSELDEVTEYDSTNDDEEAQPESISISSNDEFTSDSDSE